MHNKYHFPTEPHDRSQSSIHNVGGNCQAVDLDQRLELRRNRRGRSINVNECVNENRRDQRDAESKQERHEDRIDSVILGTPDFALAQQISASSPHDIAESDSYCVRKVIEISPTEPCSDCILVVGSPR
jgi:hypothetical protein